MNKSDQINELAVALIAMQKEMGNPTFDAENDYYGHKYVSLSAMIDHVRPKLAKHGLAVVQFLSGVGHIETVLIHSSGQWISEYGGCTPKDMNDPQAAGSAFTYSRRYGLASVLNIAGEADDDANMASGKNQKKDTQETEGTGKVARGKVISCKEEKMKSGQTIYKVEIEGLAHKVDTFDVNLALLATELIKNGMVVEANLEKNRFGWRLLELRPIPFPADSSASDPSGKDDDLPL